MRANARKIAFHLLFEKEYGKETDPESLFAKELLTQEKVFSEEDKAFIKQLIINVTDNKKEIKKIILSNLVGYTFNRIHRVDAVVLMIAVAEMFFIKETDKKIIINEAVNISKIYGGEKSTSFVNGVLANIVKEN